MREEKEIKRLADFLEKKSEEGLNLDELNDFDELMPEFKKYLEKLEKDSNGEPCADDYLGMADDSENEEEQLEYIDKALELEPDNLDALEYRLELTADNTLDLLEGYAALIEKGNKLMIAGNYFRDYKGKLWYCIEARPYLWLRKSYFDLLVGCGKMRAAVAEAKEILKLCEDDNMGMRMNLMHLYAYLEEESAAKKLFIKYYREETTSMLLPLAVLYYKINKPDIAEKYLRKLCDVNEDIKEFISGIVDNTAEEYFENANSLYYEPDTMENLVDDIQNYGFLYINAGTFFYWADSILKTEK